jgi:hypothetical protein
MRRLASGDLDWASLLRAAELGGVEPLLYARLNELVPAGVPPAVRQRLRAAFRVTALRNLVLASELVKLLAILRAGEIRAIAFKGPTLAMRAYGDLALRAAGDLDVLVDETDVRRAGAILESLGYRPELAHAGWEYHFVGPAGQPWVDLHQKLAPAYFPSPGSFEELWAACEPVGLGGTPVRAPSREQLLFILAVHFAKDCRERKERISEVVDIAWLVRLPGLAWNRVLALADARRARRLLLFALDAAHHLVGCGLPAQVLDAIHADAGVTKLSTKVRARLLEQARGDDDMLRYRTDVWYEDSRFYLALREHPADRVRYLGAFAANHLRLWLTPSDRDRRFVALPRQLAGMYYLLRPIRLGLEWLHHRRFGRRSAVA